MDQRLPQGQHDRVFCRGVLSMTARAYIRVTMAEDGKTPQRELMLDGQKVADLSYFEVLEFAMQAVSSLRFEVTGKR